MNMHLHYPQNEHSEFEKMSLWQYWLQFPKMKHFKGVEITNSSSEMAACYFEMLKMQ